MKKLSAIFLAVIVSFFAWSPVRAQTVTATVIVNTDKSSYTVGEQVKVTTVVADENGNPIRDARVLVTIRTVLPPISIPWTSAGQMLYTDTNGVSTVTTSMNVSSPTVVTAESKVSEPITGTPTFTDVTVQSQSIDIGQAAAPAPASTPTPSGGGSTTTATDSAGSGVTIPNPIKCDDINCLIGQVIRYILGTIAIVATMMFIWGGFMMLTSGGSAERIKKAKETLAWASIGIVVIMLSWAIIRFVLQGLINSGKT